MNPPLIVQKYGGTSVGTPERIRAVAERIRATREQGHPVVVVVSAMGHTTDELIELAHRVSERPPHREMDMLLTVGERVSMALLSMALADQGVPAISLTGSQTGIITDESHRRARVRRILGDRVRAGLAQGKVVIVAGFQGVSETKEITTLGRGGSDTTAVALAAALKADFCDIFTDVDGVFSADPRVVASPRFWKRIPHDLMVEMATRGAGVLHPRSVELAKQFQVPLRVRNSLNESEGTHVISLNGKLGDPGACNQSNVPGQSQGAGMEDYSVTGVTADLGRLLLTVELQRFSVLGALWGRALEAHLSILSPLFAGTQVQLFVERESEGEWKKILEGLVRDGFVKTFELDSRQVPVSVIGQRFSQDCAAFHDVIESLASCQISATMGVSSALAMTVAVSRDQAQEAVRALHARFFSSDQVKKG